MNLRDLTLGARYGALFWVLVSLGSCAIIQNYDNRVINFTIASDDDSQPRCKPFVRTMHLGHNEPTPPNVDPTTMSDEAFADLVLSHAEKLKEYLDNERRYMAEDVARHMDTCK